MMGIAWQDLITAGIVLLASAYVARHVVRFVRRKGAGGCRCCPQCPMESQETPVVKLDERARK